MKRLLIVAMMLFLAACGNDYSDLDQWIQETRKTAQATPTPLPSTMPYTPYKHQVSTKPNAFDAVRLKLARLRPGGDLERPKEPLEAFDLVSLAMVGTLEKAGMIQALVRADGRIYSVHVGNYMGNNYGKIVAIKPEAITLQETVEDLNGEWTTRETLIDITETEGR